MAIVKEEIACYSLFDRRESGAEVGFVYKSKECISFCSIRIRNFRNLNPSNGQSSKATSYTAEHLPQRMIEIGYGPPEATT